MVKLYFKKLGEGPPLLILHGLFGSSDNWQTHAKTFAEHHTVYLVDQRNHGHSPHTDEFNYSLMAEDLYELIADEGLRDVSLIGHSMGGKTILWFAQQYGFLVHKMIVADMGIKAYPPHHDQVFAGLFEVDVDQCESRKQAEERLSKHVQDKSTIQFLLKNLYWKEPGKLAWRFNLPVLFAKREEAMKAVPEIRIDADVLFLRGGQSHYVKDEDISSIQQRIPHATFETIPQAGHWLHAEAPTEFVAHCLKYLSS
ncbi:MAG: alpha/beta fold hydrolase [Flavobacteriales bacterium]|nr:alpha/beta fold hydrolase [Flavobacteriales bacterium]